MAESKTQEHRPAPKKEAESDTGDLGSGVSPEGVPYAPPNVGGHEHELREESEEDRAHAKAVEDARKDIAEAEARQARPEPVKSDKGG